MLVKCRQDITGLDPLARQAIPQIASERAFNEGFDHLVPVVATDVLGSLEADAQHQVIFFAATDIAATIFSNVGAAVASELGVDAGLATAGTLSSWETFGVGLVAAIVVDIGLDWLEKLAGNDPEKAISEKVDAILDHVKTLVIDGNPEACRAYRKLRRLSTEDPDAAVRSHCKAAADRIERGGQLGIKEELRVLERQRARLREKALEQLILGGG